MVQLKAVDCWLLSGHKTAQEGPQKARRNKSHPTSRWPRVRQVILGHLLTLRLAQEALKPTNQGSREGPPVTKACFPAEKNPSVEVGDGMGAEASKGT